LGSGLHQLSRSKRARTAGVALLMALGLAPSSTESAVANGDTRTISLINHHTDESGEFTYLVNGAYDKATLEKLNWFLRDWRLNEPTHMDPKLFDILWDVYRQSGSHEPIDVLSAYRSPQTNAMLRRRSRQVAEHSQHMEGKAIDAHFTDVTTGTIRDIAMRMQAGGVGFYPTGITPWVHIDSGEVRYWPRMNRDALARLFPDGKTVFIPADGQPMPGYDVAKAEIEARGGDVSPTATSSFNVFAGIFGGRNANANADEGDDSGEAPMIVATGRGHAAAMLSAPSPAEARRNLPRGETFAEAAPNAELTSSDAEGASPITLRGPVAAEFIAPLPPRRPAEFAALAEAPPPPRRPAEFAVASASSKPVDVSGGDRDLIRALLKHGGAPSVITRGLVDRPHDALALTETVEAPMRTQDIAAAAALAAPMPPPRPPLRLSANEEASSRSAETTTAARAPVEALRPSLDPFGGIAAQVFESNPSPLADALRLKAMASSN